REEAARAQAAKEQDAREQAARDQAAKEQAAREEAARAQAAKEQAAREEAARAQAAKEQAAREEAAREQAEQAAREQADQVARDQGARASFEQRRNPISPDEMPALPNAAEIASGHVWPPVKGRASVSVATSGRISVSPEVQPWAPADAFELVSDAGWLLHSSPRWLYDSESVARHRLLAYVRGQISRGGGIPEGRTLAVAKDGERWRLWLLTPQIQPLSQRIIAALDASDPATTSVSMKEVLTAMRELRELGLGGKEIAAGISGLAMHERKLAVLPLDEGEGEPRLEPREPFAELVQVIGASVGSHAALRRWFEDEGRTAIERASAQ
ncbi:MAG TPA: hypothetical protein VLB44_01560, partial [Kofleriaceae bacterium]|nr:hypothetical protein [Kofleriaceae bacterium]